jgi:hypothetical protein
MVSCAIELRLGIASHALALRTSPTCRLSLGDVHPAKPKRSYKRGAYASSAIQNRTDNSAINAMTVRESGLTSLAFNCDSQQIKNVVIIKYEEITRIPRRLHPDVVGTLPIIAHVSAESIPPMTPT